MYLSKMLQLSNLSVTCSPYDTWFTVSNLKYMCQRVILLTRGLSYISAVFLERDRVLEVIGGELWGVIHCSLDYQGAGPGAFLVVLIGRRPDLLNFIQITPDFR